MSVCVCARVRMSVQYIMMHEFLVAVLEPNDNDDTDDENTMMIIIIIADTE